MKETETVTLTVKTSEIRELVDWLELHYDKPVNAITLLACTMIEIAKLVSDDDNEARAICIKILNATQRVI